MFYFVGDPRYSVPTKILTKEFKALKDGQELHTNFLDYLLRAALRCVLCCILCCCSSVVLPVVGSYSMLFYFMPLS